MSDWLQRRLRVLSEIEQGTAAAEHTLAELTDMEIRARASAIMVELREARARVQRLLEREGPHERPTRALAPNRGHELSRFRPRHDGSNIVLSTGFERP
jgi:hypothetical protein